MIKVKVIYCQNVNDALEQGLAYLKVMGREENSRNGPVIVAPGPVITSYERPWERVLFSAARDANPFFHLYEALWMLAGANDVTSVANYAARMKEFSDDGENLHGAYGFRWREWFGFDQLKELIKHLREQPNSRRAVLNMWSPNGDLIASEGYGGLNSKDLPCNTHVYFRRRYGALDMTICCRSNDVVWGAYGANAVHFSILHEFMARAVELVQGTMYQFSNDYHIYKSLPQFGALWSAVTNVYDQPYARERVVPLLISFEHPETFLRDCELMVKSGIRGTFNTYFFKYIVVPMLEAHGRWRAGLNGTLALTRMPDCDWRTAARAWLERRISGMCAL